MWQKICSNIAKATVMLLMAITLPSTESAESSKSRELFRAVPAERITASPMLQSKLQAIRKRPAVTDVSAIKVMVELLKDSVKPFTLRVSPEKSYLVILEQSIQRSDGYVTVRGVLERPAGHASFVIRNGDVTGTIWLGRIVYRIQPLGEGVHALIQLDQSKFPPEHPMGRKRGTEKESSASGLGGKQDAADNPDDARHNPPLDTVFTILVAFTNDANAANPNLDALAINAVDTSNQSYENSDIKLQIVLVHNFQVNYNEAASCNDNLNRWRNDNDGHMDNVHNLRKEYGADVAVLLVDDCQDQGNNFCGRAYDVRADSDDAFAVVRWDCAVDNFSFPHEVGHLQGARHNPQADASNNPYAYGHGYLNAGLGWRTIMAYNDDINCPNINPPGMPVLRYCARLQHWSNPNINHPTDNVPMGDTMCCDNARVLNENDTRVANLQVGQVGGGGTARRLSAKEIMSLVGDVLD